MDKIIRILLVEDSEDDAFLLLRELRRGEYKIFSERVQTSDGVRKTLQEKEWDIVISDFSMPNFNALAALELLKESGKDIPFLIVSGVIGEETAVQAMKAGAHDYLKKDNLHRLLPAIERELRESANRVEKRKAEESLRNNARLLAEAQRLARLGNWDWGIQENIVVLSEELFRITQLNPLTFNHTFESFLDHVHPQDIEQVRISIENALKTRNPLNIEYRVSSSPKECYVQARAEITGNDQDNSLHMFGTIQDISERKHYEKEKSFLEEQLRNTVFDSIIMVDPDLRITRLNEAAARFFLISQESALGMNLKDLCGPERKNIVQVVKNALQSREYVREYQLSGQHQGNNWTYILGITPMKDNTGEGVVLVIRDISRLHSLEMELLEKKTFGNIIGKSPRMVKIFDMIRHLEEVDSTVLIQGPSGTGKELAASALHYHSLRRNGPYIKVNCAALPENLLESELFGHVRGAFTGAANNKAGRFELADKGTLFLDEIGDISLNVQKRLLRVLQEREIERVGSTKTTKIDVRILAATNKNLFELVTQGEFREDLFYRLNVITIDLPPLRDRKEDIPLLVNHFFVKFRDRFGRNIKGIAPEVMDILLHYSWPGNVRQLENVIEHAIALTRGDIVLAEYLPSDLFPSSPPINPFPSPLTHSVPEKGEMEIDPKKLLQTLQSVNWNRSKAARILGVCRNTIWRNIKKYGLTPPKNAPVIKIEPTQ